MKVRTESKFDDDKMAAAVALIGNCGARTFQIRYDEEQAPIVWVAVAEFRINNQGKVVKHGRTVKWEAAAGLEPVQAVLRLCDVLIDGGSCTHCKRPSGVTDDWEGDMPFDQTICWYRYDPELKKFRRGCEGDT